LDQRQYLATCPITELGFLRISTHPKALNSDVASARELLKNFIASHSIEFFPADLPALGSNPATTDAVTDFYLADLAVSRGFKLATLDERINHPAIELVQ